MVANTHPYRCSFRYTYLLTPVDIFLCATLLALGLSPGYLLLSSCSDCVSKITTIEHA